MRLARSTLAKPLTPTMERELRHFRADEWRRSLGAQSPSALSLVDRGLAERRRPTSLKTGRPLNSAAWQYRLTAAGVRAQGDHGGPA